jgi:uncharacterized protein
MLYDALNQLRRGRIVRCTIEAPPPAGTGETLVGLVRGEITLSPVGKTVLAHGHVSVTVTLRCARCLRLHDAELYVAVDKECSLLQIDDPKSYSDSGDDLPSIPILSGDQVDLSELVRQLVVINLPPRSLCRADCKGLCPQCGADLNDGPCGCEKQEIDPRLAPLKALLDRR